MVQDLGRTGTPDEIVRAELARADRLRRVRASSARLWRTAPWASAVCALVAGIGRVAGWPGIVSIALLTIALGSLAGYVFYARRPRPVTDVDAADLDSRASLRGELRSAYWFANVPAEASAHAENPWVEFHLARAADRLRAIDWSALYPAERATREKIATALLTVLVLVAALFVPGRSPLSALASGGNASDVRLRGSALPSTSLPSALLDQIEKLLTAAEASGGKALTAAQVQDLLAKLDQLKAGKADMPRAADGKAPQLTKADAKALAERARKDADNPDLEPEVRDALTDLANKLSDDPQQRASTAQDAREASGAKDTQQGDTAQSAAAGDKQDGSTQSVKDAASGGGVGIVMMNNEDGAKSKEAGLGLGGGDGDNAKGGSMPDLAAALRKETVEAKTDNPGENVFTGVNRKTEHGDAALAYTHAQPGAAERGHSTAPPAVPDNRRAAVKGYFTRKQ